MVIVLNPQVHCPHWMQGMQAQEDTTPDVAEDIEPGVEQAMLRSLVGQFISQEADAASVPASGQQACHRSTDD